ncbi:MAG: phage major capsid protein [Kiritimatiellales bacterium]
MEKRLNEIMARKAEIKNELGTADEKRLVELDTEVTTLEAEETALRNKQNLEGRLGKAVKPTVDSESEKRGKALMEKRAVTIASTGVIIPSYQAADIKPTFNEVSTLLDNVNIKHFTGGESFKQPYSTGYGEGEYATENDSTLTDADATFGYADVTKSKIVAYTEDSEELNKLPAANFDGEVVKGISIALRKKITKEILIGDGTTGHFVGIFDNNATAIDAAKDIDFAEIDENTLDEIIYSFGGDENVEDIAVLVLNKVDLKAFAMLRDSNGRKIHDVKAKGNYGIIDNIPFIINSNCKAISAAATTTGQYCMAYGPLSNYTMAIFSDIDVQRSTDYKFREGMIAHRGVVFSGGNVTAKNGFLRVKRT